MKCCKKYRKIVLQPAEVGFIEKMGSETFFKDKEIAIVEIHKKINKPCKVKAFDVCNI